MKIIACVKRVPDTEAKIQIAADGKSIQTAGVNFIMNPYDEFAVEEALRIKEKFGGEVTVLSLGDDNEKEIRNALAMGADDAIYLKETKYTADLYATAKTLADTLKNQKFDLIIMGKMAVDDGACSVGPLLSEFLGIPCISSVEKVEMAADKFIAHMPVEGGSHVFEVPLPAIFTADKGLNEPRYPSLKGIMMAKKKKVDSRPTTAVPSKCEVVKMSSPPPRPAGKIVGEGAAAVPKLVELLRTEAKVI